MDQGVVHFTIDGREIEASGGASVLEAVRKAGIEIPTLCWRAGLEPYGACRLCLVEIQRRGWTPDWIKVTASCTLPVEDGLRVETQSPRVRELRQSVMQLLLARCPDSPEIRQMARTLGVEPDPRLVQDKQSCVLCGMCVRVCADVTGAEVINFRHRGIRRDIGTPFGTPSELCLTCGACQSVCPTGAIDLKLFSTRRPRPARSDYDKGLVGRRAIYLPFLQSVPRAPVIDPAMCMRLNREQCGQCELACEAKAIDYTQRPSEESIEVGAVILAPGLCEFDATRARPLGYGRLSNVVTSVEFERILSASGPFSGHVERPSDRRPPRRVAFVQCVGSRNLTDRGHEYCSSVCCTCAVKQATVTREHDSAIKATIFNMDMRTFGKDFDKYYERARKAGIRFVRSAVAGIEEVPETGNLLVQYVGEKDTPQNEEYDLVVLSVGLQPARGAAELAHAAGIELDEHGFAATAPTDPLSTSRPGVFACGVFAGPKDIPESVMEASGAASCAAVLLAEARGTRVEPKTYPAEEDTRGIEPRIGVFVCHCGINIAGVVDVADAARYASQLPGVVFAETNLYTCSQDTQERIRNLIHEHQLNRIVVASCSPRTHETLFQETARQAGLNRHLIEMANIRDQCSWVHQGEPGRATDKSKDLLRMAVARARLAEPLYPQMLPVTRKALVVGGGLAGMTAALAIADAGFDVFLVEKQERLGGHLRRLGPTVEGIKPHELLAELEKRLTGHQRIRVFTQSEIASVEGFVGNFKTTLRTSGNGAGAPLEHGVAIIAIGGNESRPNEYLFGQDARVVTQLDFEEELDREGARVPDRIVMIQCVGSRETGHLYCSRVCCTAAVHNALRAKQLNPKAEVYILCRDVRTYGFYEKAYREAREREVQFVLYDPSDKPRVSIEGGQLHVELRDPVLGRKLRLHPDRLVLSARIDAPADGESLAQLFKVPLNEDRFFLEAHVKLRPVDFATEGVFVAGLAHGPKPIRATIAQTRAAAGRAMTILVRDKVEAPATVSYVLSNRCMGCGQCETLCAYSAISIDATKGVAVVNEVLCKGCGACAASCRSSAIMVRGSSDSQIWTMIEAFAEQ